MIVVPVGAVPVGADTEVRASSHSAIGVDAVLDVLRRHAVALCAGSSRPPSRVRLAAGEIEVEVGWPETPHAVPPPRDQEDGSAVMAGQTELGTGGPRADLAVHHVCATTVGVFYRAHEPGVKPLASEGDTVTAGQQVAIVEVMKLMIPLHTDWAGTVVEILAENGASVEYGQPLLAIASADGSSIGADR